MTGAIIPSIKGYLTIQRNTNMLKNLKKVSFCRFYRFICKNAVPRLSPERTFFLQHNACKTPCVNVLQSTKQALKKYSASGNKRRIKKHKQTKRL